MGSHTIKSRASLLAGFAKEFDEKHSKARGGKSVFDAPKTMARLRKQSKKIKEVLSANVETNVLVRPVRLCFSA